VSPAIATAIRTMVHDGLQMSEAAQAAGITTHRLRLALDLPHVRAFIRAEKNVRLEAIRLGSLNELERIRRGEGMAAIAAIKFLEEMADEGRSHASTGMSATPGVTIVIQSHAHTVEDQHVSPLTIEAETSMTSPESPPLSDRGEK
jgi:hypothetical protein